MKLKYVPGIRPTPMLMYQTDFNKNVYDELLELMIDKMVKENVVDQNKKEIAIKDYNHFTESFSHWWNMNGYIVLDEDNNKVVTMVFAEFAYVIYLLRVINKEVTIEIDDNIYKIIEKDLKELEGELEIIK